MIKNLHKPLFLLAFSTALGGVTTNANAEYIRTNGDAAAYTVEQVTDKAKIAAGDYDFRWYTGLDEDNNPVFEYYTYEIKPADEDPLRADGRLVVESDNISINNNFVGIDNDVKYEYEGVLGSAISSESHIISGINGDLIENSARGNETSVLGGAINNNMNEIATLSGDFIDNYATATSTGSTTASTKGGVIYNYNGTSIGNIRGNFIGNNLYSKHYAYGGAICNEAVWDGSSYTGGSITSIVGSFIGNYAISTKSGAYGGAVYNSGGTIDSITGNFIENYAEAIQHANGGAISNDGSISTITGDFIRNHATITQVQNVNGGAIVNWGTIGTIVGNFIENYVSAEVDDSWVRAKGGAIQNQGTITTLSGDFIGNYAVTSTQSETKETRGGAIYNQGTVGIQVNGLSLNSDVLFKNNYIKIETEQQYEAIYNTGSSTTLNFTSNNGGTYTFYDYINGDNTATINFVSDDKDGATFNLYNDIKGQANVNFKNKYVLNMISPEDIHKDVFTSKLSYIQAKNITISAAIQMAVDVDLAAGTMDHFEAENFAISGGSLNITTFNILTAATDATTSIPFIVLAEGSTVEDNIAGLVPDETLTYVKEASYGGVTYTVEYDEENAQFVFKKTAAPTPAKPGRTGDTKKAGAAAGATQAVTSAVAGQTMSHGGTTVFNGMNSGDEPLGLTAWVQAFGSNDDVELKHMSEKVDTQFYGLVGGIDSKRFTYDNGVNAVYGVFGAFVNGKQKLDDSKITNKSGYLGLSASLRNKALFSNFTLTGGFIANEASSEFGKDKFDTKVVSVANKTGVDIQKGAWTITPSLLLSYTGIDTDDYTTKAGTKIDNDFMHVYTVAPELKVAKDFGEGFSGYAKVAYKMFFYSNEKIEADDVLMPAMSVKPYVEYGIGASKDWSKTEWNAHDIATYGEITRHDGGRTGWDLNLGLKLDF